MGKYDGYARMLQMNSFRSTPVLIAIINRLSFFDLCKYCFSGPCLRVCKRGETEEEMGIEIGRGRVGGDSTFQNCRATHASRETKYPFHFSLK